MPARPWAVIASELALDAPLCQVRKDTVRLPDGRLVDDYFRFVRPDAVVVLAVSTTGAVPLVRQYKHGIGRLTLELPAGVIDDEAPLAAATRELREETGWQADHLRLIGEFFDDTSKSTSTVYGVLAQDAERRGPQELDPNEKSSGVEVVTVRLVDLPELVRTGEIRAVSSVVTILAALAWLAGQPAK